MLLRFFTAVLVGALIGGCSGTPTGSYAVPQQRRDGEHRLTRSNPISHVVVIVQENRSFDNLFQFFPERTPSHGATVFTALKCRFNPLC